MGTYRVWIRDTRNPYEDEESAKLVNASDEDEARAKALDNEDAQTYVSRIEVLSAATPSQGVR